MSALAFCQILLTATNVNNSLLSCGHLSLVFDITTQGFHSYDLFVQSDLGYLGTMKLRGSAFINGVLYLDLWVKTIGWTVLAIV
jgi:hypothetical protein